MRLGATQWRPALAQLSPWPPQCGQIRGAADRPPVCGRLSGRCRRRRRRRSAARAARGSRWRLTRPSPASPPRTRRTTPGTARPSPARPARPALAPAPPTWPIRVGPGLPGARARAPCAPPPGAHAGPLCLSSSRSKMFIGGLSWQTTQGERARERPPARQGTPDPLAPRNRTPQPGPAPC